jgi:hypothetical protein
MTDPRDRRAALERACDAMPRAYRASALVVLGAVITIAGTNEAAIGWAMLGLAAAASIAAFIGQRVFERQLGELDNTVGSHDHQIDHLGGRIATLGATLAGFTIMAVVFVGFGIARFAHSRPGAAAVFLFGAALAVRVAVKAAQVRSRLVSQRSG